MHLKKNAHFLRSPPLLIIFVSQYFNQSMKRFIKFTLILSGVITISLYAFADRGVRRKAKNNVVLNIATEQSFKNSLSVNLKNGMKLKGILRLDHLSEGNQFNNGTLRYYQKGNTYYLLPSKPKLVNPEVKPGYTGLKLTLQSRP